ncbi:tetratricopeptide repeat protein [Planctomycetota bacterium]
MRYVAFAAVFMVIFVLFTGCEAQDITKTGGFARKYNVVTLEELINQPQMFTSVPIKFRCLMGKTGNIYVAMNTHFTGTDTINFGVWPEETRMWDDAEARDKYHPLLYIQKSSSNFALFRDIKQYEVIDIFGVVRDTYARQPWIEVVSLRRVLDEELQTYVNHFTAESKFYIKNAIDYEKAKELDFAIEDFSAALKMDLPLFAEVEILHRLGILLAEKGDYKAARDRLEDCVAKQTGGFYEAFALLGEVYRQLNDFDEAVDNSKRALLVKPDYVPALRTYGISLALHDKNPDYIEAERKCLRALKFDSTDPETNWYLGIIYGLQKEYDKSIDFYKIAIDNYPQEHRYHKGLAAIHHLRSNVAGVSKDQGISDKRIALHEYDIVRTILTRTGQQDPDVYYFKGVVNEELAALLPNDAEMLLKEATTQYEQCVKIDDTYKDCWYALALRYVGYERYTDAVNVYDNLLKMEPKSIEILMKKAGMLYTNLKDKPKAVGTLKKVVKLDGDHVEANYLIGRYMLETGWETKDADDAKKACKESRAFLETTNKLTDETDIRAMRDYVFVLYELKEDKSQTKAYYILEDLMEDETKVEALSAKELVEIFNKTAQAFTNIRKDDEAAVLWEKSLVVDKAQFDVLMAVANYNLEEGEFEIAKEKAKEAASINQKSIEALDLYAWALAKSGENERALPLYLQKAVQAVINQKPTVKYHLGIVYYNLKKYAEAAATLNSTAVLNHAEVGKDAKKKLKDARKKAGIR